jgi:hypothetical protein
VRPAPAPAAPPALAVAHTAPAPRPPSFSHVALLYRDVHALSVEYASLALVWAPAGAPLLAVLRLSPAAPRAAGEWPPPPPLLEVRAAGGAVQGQLIAQDALAGDAVAHVGVGGHRVLRATEVDAEHAGPKSPLKRKSDNLADRDNWHVRVKEVVWAGGVALGGAADARECPKPVFDFSSAATKCTIPAAVLAALPADHRARFLAPPARSPQSVEVQSAAAAAAAASPASPPPAPPRITPPPAVARGAAAPASPPAIAGGGAAPAAASPPAIAAGGGRGGQAPPQHPKVSPRPGLFNEGFKLPPPTNGGVKKPPPGGGGSPLAARKAAEEVAAAAAAARRPLASPQTPPLSPPVPRSPLSWSPPLVVNAQPLSPRTPPDRADSN